MITLKRIYILSLTLFLSCSFLVSAVLLTNHKTAYVNAETINSKYPTIIVDAGHGGEDGGTTSLTGELEKDINLEIALTLEKLLIQSGFNVNMIRTTDVSVYDVGANTLREKKISDIHNRVEVANSDKNNLLISIHQNYFGESKYFGTQIFYSKNNEKSKVLAENIRNAVTSLLQPQNTRKCKNSSNVYLLDNVTVPAVIVECGFISNPDEAYLLSTKEYRDNIAYSIYLGIVEYIFLNY